MTTRILAGDCLKILPTLESESIDLILTDPPYGETSLEWDRWQTGWPALVRRVLKPTGSMWVFGSQRMFWDNRDEFAGWKLSQDIVWEKQNGSGLFNDRFRRVHENALHFYRDDSTWAQVYKDPQKTNDATARTVRKKGRPAQWIGATGETSYTSEDGGPRLMRSVIYVRNEHGRAEHPTQKPPGILEPLLLYSSPLGGMVLDPFSGSGGVGAVAGLHGRNSILIEARPEFVELTRRSTLGDWTLGIEAAL
jgi:site-specific DNA-methyltransferase (adenine-specific)